ncbi:FUSC family protein [Streptomyces sp. NPDC007206]|uniref:FUSC family protein n=1 Tax=Streptomyces sp. NPDC007206 TaxID=3154317 RepID=UPI0033ECF8B6
MQELWRKAAGVRDRFLASDPGLIRLLSAIGTVCAVLTALGVLAALHAPVPVLVTGALTAMASTVAVTEPRPRDQALTLAAGVPVTLAITALGSALAPYRVVADVVFVLLIFAALHVRRLGPRATTLGVFAFQLFFVTQFVQARVAQLPQLFLAVTVAFGSSALVRFAVLRSNEERTSARLHRAFRVRLAYVLDALIEVTDGGPRAPRAARAVDGLRRRVVRLHTAASMVQDRQPGGGASGLSAVTPLHGRGRAAEAVTAVERLAITVLRFVWPETDIDTLTRHRSAPRLVGPVVQTRDAAALTALTAELRALRGALGSGRMLPVGDGAGQCLSRDCGDEECLPDVSPALQDVFRTAGEFACAVCDLDAAADEGDADVAGNAATAVGSTAAVVGSTPGSGEQSREEHLPGDAVRAADAPGRNAGAPDVEADSRRGEAGARVRPTTRTALQVATGSALAVVGGELLSPQRWYWAVFTSWVVYIGTASTGDLLVRGFRRLVGTVAGVFAGLALAALIGDDPRWAFALAILSVFGMYYTTAVSYTLMSLFVTTMIGMLYTLLHTLTPAVLVVRIEETALGVGSGLVAAALVLPVGTRQRTDELLREVLERLREALAESSVRWGGGPGKDLFGPSRALGSALDSLRVSMQPLIIPVSPLRSRRRTAIAVLGLLETAAFHARGVADGMARARAGGRLGAEADLVDETLAEEVRRIDRNLASLIGRVAGTGGTALERGCGIAARLAAVGTAAGDGSVRAKRRVLRHLHRVDMSVQELGQTLGMPVRDGA